MISVQCTLQPKQLWKWCVQHSNSAKQRKTDLVIFGIPV